MTTNQRADGLLSDGTALESLVPRTGDRTVSARVFSDQEIYQLELERIFDRNWIFVAHESEIPKTNDFVSRYIGEDPVIVTRDSEGGISVLLNSCSHRGPQVCSAESGSAAVFRCPYHGWTYDTTGELIGVLGERLIYGECLDKASLGLKRARVGVYHGLIFATWNEQAVSLEEYLGPSRADLDVVFGLSKNGMEVVGPPQRWIIPANWKFGSDNFSVDNYHTSIVHETLGHTVPGLKLDVASTSSRVMTYTDPARGHAYAGFVEADASMPKEAYLDIAAQIAGIPQNLVPELRSSLDERQVGMLLRLSAGAGNIWPNLSWIRSGFLDGEAPFPQGALSIRFWQPRGPNKMEAFSWTLVYRDAPEEVKKAAARQMVHSFGSSGNFEQDDAEVWMGAQLATAGVQGRKRLLSYGAVGKPEPAEPGAVLAYRHQICDDSHWHFYARWRDVMATGSDR